MIRDSGSIDPTVFGTTVLGLVGRDLVVVARGAELEKLKQGFMLRDAVYSFGIALDR